MDPLFPALPEADAIAALSNDEIQALIDERLAIVAQVKERDETLLAGRGTTEVVAELQAGVEGIKQLKAELQTRDQLQAEADAAIDALTEEAVGNTEVEETEETPAAETEPTAAETPEDAPVAIAAAATPSRPFRTTRPVVKVDEPDPQPNRVALVAAGGIDGFAEGSELTGRLDLARALIAKRGNMIATPDGHEEKIRVARATFNFPEDRTLQVNDPEGNWEKVANVVGPRAEGKNFAGEPALVASGGLCAPVTPYYDLELVATTARPVRDSLPVFNAARGGINFAPPPGLSVITNGVGYLTAAQDKTGGTTGAKSCQAVNCPSFTEVDVAMIYKCLKFGNLGSRAWPEQVTQFEGLASAAFARLAETKLLDGISAASIKATGAQFGGAAATWLGQVETAAAGQRNRLRMDPDAVLRVLAPAWVRDMMVVDNMRGQFDRYGFSLGQVEQYLRDINIAISWYIDGTTTGGQVFGTQTAAALIPFPTTIQWWIFPEGSFIFLDAGTLDVGLVRDSTLNLSNDYQVFNEAFENIAFTGVESIQVITTTCANGQVIAPVTAPACAA